MAAPPRTKMGAAGGVPTQRTELAREIETALAEVLAHLRAGGVMLPVSDCEPEAAVGHANSTPPKMASLIAGLVATSIAVERGPEGGTATDLQRQRHIPPISSLALSSREYCDTCDTQPPPNTSCHFAPLSLKNMSCRCSWTILFNPRNALAAHRHPHCVEPRESVQLALRGLHRPVPHRLPGTNAVLVGVVPSTASRSAHPVRHGSVMGRLLVVVIALV